MHTLGDMQLEVGVIPVADVERSKRFYTGPGWRLDADFAAGDAYRIVQFTPPGSACSIHLWPLHSRALDRRGGLRAALRESGYTVRIRRWCEAACRLP